MAQASLKWLFNSDPFVFFVWFVVQSSCGLKATASFSPSPAWIPPARAGLSHMAFQPSASSPQDLFLGSLAPLALRRKVVLGPAEAHFDPRSS